MELKLCAALFMYTKNGVPDVSDEASYTSNTH